MCKLFPFLFPLLLLGCKTSAPSFSTNLQQLDKLLGHSPKSVADSLSHLDISRMNKADQAYFYLLEASAKDKNYRKLTSDSTLRIAEKYFTQTNDRYNLGRTQYYIAKYFFNANQPTDAFIILKEAENNIHQAPPTDFHLLGLIYSQHGAIHARQGNYQEAQYYYQKSFNAFTETKDTVSMLISTKQLAWALVCQEKYKQSKEILQKGIDIIEQNTKTNNPQLLQIHASLLNVLNLYYQKTKNYNEALNVSKQAIILLEKENIHVPSNYYSALITTYIDKHQIDSIYPYCQKMLTNSITEKNLLNQLTVYKNLIDYEKTKRNYKPLSEHQEKYIELKDTYNKQLKFNEVIKLEKKYNYSEKERLYYKAKTKNLWLLILMLILIIIASLILLYSTWLQRKLKDKNLQLSEQIKKVEWGLVLSKELIRENSNQYIQLEKVLNRYATLVPQQLFEEFRSLHHSQQIQYSQRLLFSLTNINNEFSRKLKQKHPNLTSNDILLASMIHYQWELENIAHVFQTSLEAIQKRSIRLKTKLERKERNIESLEKYLIKNLKQCHDNTCPATK